MTNCPDCGREVESIFDHLGIDNCAAMSDDELKQALDEELEA